MTRMISASTQPRKYPASRPSVMPPTSASDTTTAPISSEKRAP